MGENSVKNVQPKQRAIVTRMCRVTGKYRVSGRVGPLVVQREHDQIVQGGREVQMGRILGTMIVQEKIVAGMCSLTGNFKMKRRMGAIVKNLCRVKKIRLCRVAEGYRMSRILRPIVTKVWKV